MVIPAGQTSATLTVATKTDFVVEGTETVIATIGTGTGYTVGAASATGNITDVAPASTLNISAPASVTEGNTGTTPYSFTVTRTGTDFSQAASATWTLTNTGTNPTDSADFTGSTSGTVTWVAGDSANKTITVNVVGDTVVEQNETFTVTLSNPSNVGITTAAAIGTIVNDDKLVLSVASDTLSAPANTQVVGSATDNYTSNQVINVAGIPSAQAWQYSLDGGATWLTGSGTSFTLPASTDAMGTAYSLQARVTGLTSSTGTLAMTLDQIARAPIAFTYNGTNLTGTNGEPGSYVFLDNNANGVIDTGEARALVQADGTWTLAVSGLKDTNNGVDNFVALGVIDKAGNTTGTKVSEVYYFNVGDSLTISSYNGVDNPITAVTTRNTNVAGNSTLDTVQTYTDNSQTIIVDGSYINSTGSTGDFVVNTAGGDDSIEASSSAISANVHINMGDGNDYLNAQYIYGDNITVDMGNGNDIVNFTGTYLSTAVYGASSTYVNLGAGNDILQIKQEVGSSATSAGGAGIDTLKFTDSGAVQDLSHLTGYEIVDLNGTGANTLDNVTWSNVLANAPDSALHIKGGNDDIVYLGTSNQSNGTNPAVDSSGNWTKATPITENGITYDVWHSAANSANNATLDVYIQQGVQVL